MSRPHAIASFLQRYRSKQARCASTIGGELVVGTEVWRPLHGSRQGFADMEFSLYSPFCCAYGRSAQVYAHLGALGTSVVVRRGAASVTVAPNELSAILKERGLPALPSEWTRGGIDPLLLRSFQPAQRKVLSISTGASLTR